MERKATITVDLFKETNRRLKQPLSSRVRNYLVVQSTLNSELRKRVVAALCFYQSPMRADGIHQSIVRIVNLVELGFVKLV